MSSVRFLCQRCSQPLKLSQTPETLGLAQGEPGGTQKDSGSSTEVAASGGPQAGAFSCAPEPNVRTSQESVKHFTLLGKLASTRSLGSIQKTCAYILDVVSGQEGVDHPLCEECTDCLLEQLDAQLARAHLDSQTYRRCLEPGPQAGEDARAALEAELRALLLLEARLVRELGDLDRSQARLASCLSAVRAQTTELLRLDAQHLKELAALRWQQQELSEQLSSLDNQLLYAQLQMRQLRTRDIFRATFEISEAGPVGVINSFRLGRLPRVPVRWAEINAAWGQAALLLLALSRAFGLQFQRYRPVARGPRSHLKSLAGDGEELPLASDGGHSVRLDNRYDRAMLAFLDCLQQLQQEAARGGLRAPYTVHVQKGLLGDPSRPGEPCSLRTHLNTEEQWSTALRRLLSNLKCCLAWASRRCRPQ